jgi:CBS-domain-containing membrane protein
MVSSVSRNGIDNLLGTTSLNATIQKFEIITCKEVSFANVVQLGMASSRNGVNYEMVMFHKNKALGIQDDMTCVHCQTHIIGPVRDVKHRK